ncbi:class II aldolase/adducin domain-containing protein [Rhizopogon vinicolor AM-OR11-026]|uniref:Class II aldolase/adducin domain-containing protein n=1 Tax=Rhizopogon vinicolor AM-OR11-026 TaxID=1314800 RepID=A0A1B7MS29_9AGAM|nr:class II aldolase/adducin domain-containing protein [Rhizopogon vinicolor AM-OR11-026]
MTASSGGTGNSRKLREHSKDVPTLPTFSDAFEYRAFLKFRLAQAYRIFAKYGFDEGVAGHITVRDPIKPDCFWVNPWGVHFKLIQPELLLLIDHKGKIQDQESGPIRFLNRAAYMIHSAIHEARPEIICAAHSHTTYGKAFGTLGVPLDPITQDSCAFYEDHAVFGDFRGIVDDHEEGQAIAAALGSKKAAILQNHGLLVATKSIESAVFFFISLEKCCRVQMIADQAAAVRGQRPRTIDRETATLTQQVLGAEYGGWFSGIVEFQLLEHEEGKKFEYIPAGSANTKAKL